MKTLTNPDNFGFTNHFNKSLLKTRIAMMNKAKSPLWSLTKYGLFVSTLWLCAAFTKPYQAPIIAEIVTQVPVLEQIMQEETTKKVYIANDKKSLPIKQETEKNKPIADTLQLTSPTKYIIYKDDLLYWIVTPKTTLEDLITMRKEFAKYKLALELTNWKTDPMNLFLAEIEISTRTIGGGGCSIGAGNGLKVEPIQARGGYIGIKSKRGRCSTAYFKHFLPQHQNLALSEEQIAKQQYQKHFSDYVVKWTIETLGPGGGTTFTNASLKDMRDKNTKSKYINLNEEDKISIGELYKNAVFLLNGKLTTLEEIENILLKDFHSATFFEPSATNEIIKDKHVIITTHIQP